MTGEISLTRRLRDFFGGNAANAETLMQEILPKLREIAARQLHQERKPAPLEATELINELWIRNLSRASWAISDRGHFYAIASRAMRCVLTDLARKRLTARKYGEDVMPERTASTIGVRNNDTARVIEFGLLMDRLEEALPDSARVIEMHFYAGFSFREIAESTHLTVPQVKLRWKKGLQWMREHFGVSLED